MEKYATFLVPIKKILRKLLKKEKKLNQKSMPKK